MFYHFHFGYMDFTLFSKMSTCSSSSSYWTSTVGILLAARVSQFRGINLLVYQETSSYNLENINGARLYPLPK